MNPIGFVHLGVEVLNLPLEVMLLELIIMDLSRHHVHLSLQRIRLNRQGDYNQAQEHREDHARSRKKGPQVLQNLLDLILALPNHRLSFVLETGLLLFVLIVFKLATVFDAGIPILELAHERRVFIRPEMLLPLAFSIFVQRDSLVFSEQHVSIWGVLWLFLLEEVSHGKESYVFGQLFDLGGHVINLFGC